MKTLADAFSNVNCLAWGQQLLAACDDKTIRIYHSSAQEGPGGQMPKRTLKLESGRDEIVLYVVRARFLQAL